MSDIECACGAYDVPGNPRCPVHAQADCNPTDGHTPACAARSASMDSHRTCSKAPNLGPRALSSLPRCPGGCGKPIEEDGELCRGCLLGANIVNRNAIANLKGELDAVRGTRPALPSPIGEPQPGAPEGYRYGDAWQDVVQICRDATQEEAVAFLHLRFGALDAVRVLDAWVKKEDGREWAVMSWHGPHVTCALTKRYTGVQVSSFEGATASEARSAAAKALLEEDPTLGTEA